VTLRNLAVQPNSLFISYQRFRIIAREKVQGAPDLIVEIRLRESGRGIRQRREALGQTHPGTRQDESNTGKRYTAKFAALQAGLGMWHLLSLTLALEVMRLFQRPHLSAEGLKQSCAFACHEEARALPVVR
jgi:hypothetical protein